jgi:hypothetical protein
MKTRTRAGIALTVGAALALGPSLAASAAASAVVNGSFEADDIGSTSITGWSSMNQAIDLGVTSIAGCVTVDTSDYTTLREYEDYASSVWNRTFANVPGQSGDWYYVHDAFTGEPILLLGDRLVYDDDSGDHYLELETAPVSAPAFDLSSVSDPASETDQPSEPAPLPAPDETVDSDTAPEQAAPENLTPAETEPMQPAPAPGLQPAEAPAPYTYLYEGEWSSEQWDAYNAARALIPDPSVRADNLANAQLSDEEYATTIVDQAFLDVRDADEDEEDRVTLNRSGRVLELFSDLSGNEGYVVHGPAIYSAPFSVTAGRQITLDWKAFRASDDFHVFGYLLNVDTCAQTEVIDATGGSQEWTTTSVAIPSAGTYRFVFVSGSYDYSWGGAAGAYMYIDNIVQTPVFSGPGIDLALAAGIGDYLPGSDVQVSGGGLLPNSPYTLVLRSTPVTVTEGVTDGDGRFIDIVALPMDITPGAHTITLTGQGPAGPLTQVAYITVGADGTLLYFSLTGPQAALALTGPSESAGLLALAVLLTLAGAGAIELERRRRSPFSTVYVR